MDEQGEWHTFEPSADQLTVNPSVPTWQPGNAPILPAEPHQSSSYQMGAGYLGPTPSAGGGWRRALGVVALVLATVLISSALSATGAYLVYDANSHPVAAKLTGTVPAITPVASSSAGAEGVPVSLTVSQDVVKVAASVAPSVVTITTTGTAARGFRSSAFTGSGSGFVVSANGLIITNNHVVADTNSLTVALSDGRAYPATVVKTDPVNDLALISIKANGLPPVSLGNSTSVQVGQMAIAVGNPEGTFAETVTSGIISGMNRTITVGDSSTGASEDLTGLLQTDAAVNPGNSGGPLLDAAGAVVGVVTAGSSNSQGIGFAIPVDRVEALIASVPAGS